MGLEDRLLQGEDAEREHSEDDTRVPLCTEDDDDELDEEVEDEQDGWKATKEILSGAIPQILVFVSKTSITVTDTAVVGQLGTKELAAAAFASMWIQVSAVIIWAGCGDSIIALSSQAIGAENRPLAGHWLQIGLLAALVLTIPIALSWFFIGEILDLPVFKIQGDADKAEVVRLASTFGRLSTLWIVPDVITSCFCQWLNGLDIVAPSVPIHLFFVGFNLVANIFLVHGVSIGGNKFGGMGFEGSPLATTATTFFRLVALVYFMRNRIPNGVWTGFSKSAFTRERVQVFLGQAIPNSLVAVLEQSQFLLLGLLVAKFGEAQLAAHTSMMNMFDLLSGGLYGLTDAGAMRIGKELGAGRPYAAQSLSRFLFVIMGLFGALVALMFLVLQDLIGHIFSKDAEVIHYIKELSVLVGAAYLFVSVTFAAYSTLQGQGRPEKAVIAMAVGVWVFGTPSSILLGFVAKCETLCGFLGIWEGNILGYTVMTVMMLANVYVSNWDELAVQARARAEAPPVAAVSPSRSPMLLPSRGRSTPPPPHRQRSTLSSGSSA